MRPGSKAIRLWSRLGSKATNDLFVRAPRVAVLGLAVFSVLPVHLHAEEGSTRQQWLDHVADTKRRVQEEEAQRRFERPRDRVESSPEDEARRLSEIILNDDSLVAGDLVMTDKGMFVFKGRSNDEISASDFEPVENPRLRIKRK